MRSALDRQLQAYHRLRPTIREQNKDGWALVAREDLVRVFEEFDEAAAYAEKHFSDEQVLIRHTAEHRGIAPFIISRR